MSALTPDLLIVASAHADVFTILEALGSASVEVHLERRRAERRQVSLNPPLVERRGRERRILDISEALRTQGWAFIPVGERGWKEPAPMPAFAAGGDGESAQSSNPIRATLEPPALSQPSEDDVIGTG